MFSLFSPGICCCCCCFSLNNNNNKQTIMFNEQYSWILFLDSILGIFVPPPPKKNMQNSENFAKKKIHYLEWKRKSFWLFDSQKEKRIKDFSLLLKSVSHQKFRQIMGMICHQPLSSSSWWWWKTPIFFFAVKWQWKNGKKWKFFFIFYITNLWSTCFFLVETIYTHTHCISIHPFNQPTERTNKHPLSIKKKKEGDG